MAPVKIEVRIGDSSDFIKKYVEQHKKELEELRAQATRLGFKGQWFIIGDAEYPQKRLQYATTSFEEGEYSEGDGTVSRARDEDRCAHWRSSILWLLIDRASKHADRLEPCFY